MNHEQPDQVLDLLRADSVRQPPDEQLDRWAVERAIARLNRPAHMARPWWRPLRWAWLPAAGLLLVTVTVSAKLWTGKATPASVPDRPVATDTSHLPTRGAHRTAVETATPATPAVATDRRVGRADSNTAAPRRPMQQTPAALFDRARDLGREGKLDAAIAMHLRLQRSFPDSPEAALSFALSGRLLLERSRPAPALAQFDHYLHRGGAANEEALAGRAVALQQLGRQREEVAAWRRLLDRHPESVYADRAKVRLRDLSARLP